MANRISVNEGSSDTTRRAGAASVTRRPASSVTTTPAAAGAGPRRICTGFRKSPFACNDGASLSRFPSQRNHEGDRERERREADDERHQRLRRERPVAERDREGSARVERRGTVAREATPFDA